MSTISASTTSTTGFKVTSDTTGTLVFQTGASPTTAMSISSAQIISFTNPPTATGGGSVSTNTAYGTSALAANTTGADSVAVGYQAGYSNTTGNDNTIVGVSAGRTNTTGGSLTAIGRAALYANTTGNYNTALGMQSLASNTTASYNTAVGYQAGYSNTTGQYFTALGYGAGYSTTTGWQNTFVGANSGRTNSTGQYNAFLGQDSGYNATGSSNTFIGMNAGSAVTSGANNTILGRYTGNQGGLDIRTSSNYVVLSDGDGNPRAYWPNNQQMFIPSNGAIRLESDGGRIYIASITSNNQFQISYNSVSAGVSLGSAATSWGTFSDLRLKNVTGTYSNALADIAQIEPIKFTWKNDPDNKPCVGVTAQSVQNVVPEAMDSTTYEMDGDTEYLQVRYTELIPLMIASIKELKSLVEAQASEIAALKGQA